jgi:hypothetical protein
MILFIESVGTFNARSRQNSPFWLDRMVPILRGGLFRLVNRKRNTYPPGS